MTDTPDWALCRQLRNENRLLRELCDAFSPAVDALEDQMRQCGAVLDAARAFVDQQDQLASGDFAGDLFEAMKRALEAVGR